MSFDFKASLTWAKSHPWEAGGLVFIVGVGAFFLLGRQGGSSGNSDAPFNAYVSALTAQNASDNQTTAYLAKLKGDTEVAGINAKGAADIAGIYSNTAIATNASDNIAAQKVGVLAYLGQLANNLGTVLTGTSATQSGKSGGLSLGFNGFGFGFNSANSSAKATSSQTLVSNSEQHLAASTLADIASSLFHPGN